MLKGDAGREGTRKETKVRIACEVWQANQECLRLDTNLRIKHIYSPLKPPRQALKESCGLTAARNFRTLWYQERGRRF